jgi:hypothetical protein
MDGPYIEEHTLVPRLKKAIGCPIDWEANGHVGANAQLCKDLRIYWVKVAEEFQTDLEMRFYSRVTVDTNLDELGLRTVENLALGKMEFTNDDILNLPSLANKLRQDFNPVAPGDHHFVNNPEPLSIFLREQLSPETLSAIDAYNPSTTPPDPLQSLLVLDLNRIVRGNCIHTPERFATIGLSEDTKIILKREPKPEENPRRNLLLLEDGYPELASIHARGWRYRAVDEYLKRVGFINSIYFAPANEYGKHFPPAGVSRQKLLEKTVHGDSLFCQEESIDYLNFLLFSAIAVDFRNVVENRPGLLFIEADHEIGASEGQWTRILRLDMNYDKPVAHGHPRNKLPDGETLLPVNPDTNQFSNDDHTEYNNDIDEPREADFYAIKNWMAKKSRSR